MGRRALRVVVVLQSLTFLSALVALLVGEGSVPAPRLGTTSLPEFRTNFPPIVAPDVARDESLGGEPNNPAGPTPDQPPIAPPATAVGAILEAETSSTLSIGSRQTGGRRADSVDEPSGTGITTDDRTGQNPDEGTPNLALGSGKQPQVASDRKDADKGLVSDSSEGGPSVDSAPEVAAHGPDSRPPGLMKASIGDDSEEEGSERDDLSEPGGKALGHVKAIGHRSAQGAGKVPRHLKIKGVVKVKARRLVERLRHVTAMGRGNASGHGGKAHGHGKAGERGAARGAGRVVGRVSLGHRRHGPCLRTREWPGREPQPQVQGQALRESGCSFGLVSKSG